MCLTLIKVYYGNIQYKQKYIIIYDSSTLAGIETTLE